MTSMLGSLWVATALLVAPQTSTASEALAKQHGCMACHAKDQAVVGPAYEAIAKRQGVIPNAEQTLAKSIRQGVKGQWGAVPMPPNAHVSEDDALALARWILTLTK